MTSINLKHFSMRCHEMLFDASIDYSRLFASSVQFLVSLLTGSFIRSPIRSSILSLSVFLAPRMHYDNPIPVNSCEFL